MRNRWAAVAGAVLLGVLAIGAWRVAGTGPSPDGRQASPTPSVPSVPDDDTSPDGDGTGDATATPSPGEPVGTGTPDQDPSETPGPTSAPGTVGPPTASPGTPPNDAPALVGAARLTDPAGDLADSAGLPPGTARPAVDLTDVRLDGDGETLRVEFLVAGDVPSEAGSLVWSLDIWLEDTLAYTVTVQQVGTRVVSGVLDWRSSEQQPPPQAPVVQGSSVTVEVPRALLPDIDGPFRWQALGQADGGYEDYVPEDGRLTWFPGS